ncbi:6-phosphogluconate dehydrogenase, decarboxylating [compost metagenome]
MWLSLPAGAVTEGVLAELEGLLSPGDAVIDAGNARYQESMARGERLAARGVEFVDQGTSGGVWGLENGYCLMIGATDEAFRRLEPAFATLAPPEGYLHVGPVGAGHYVKMVHNGIEYGLMQAYAEGFELLASSRFEGLDLGAIAHLWNQGSVVRSWLLELAERAFEQDPRLDGLTGWVDDSGEGRWTVNEAIDQAVPTPVLALALFMRFRSRQADSFAGKVLAALRNEFGGHAVHKAP